MRWHVAIRGRDDERGEFLRHIYVLASSKQQAASQARLVFIEEHQGSEFVRTDFVEEDDGCLTL